MTRPTAILIAGPTASGKSALALELAEKFGGVIVNADSMQVYRDLRIITARPTPQDETRAKSGTGETSANCLSIWLEEQKRQRKYLGLWGVMSSEWGRLVENL